MYVQALNVQLFSSIRSLTDDGENKNVSLSLGQKIAMSTFDKVVCSAL